MGDAGRMRGENTYWMTRGQLAAIGVMSLAVTILAFFIGLRVGRSQVPQPEEVARVASLIPEDVRTDALPELLARVERAAGGHAEAGRLTFPEQLVAEVPVVEVPQIEPPPQALIELEPAAGVAIVPPPTAEGVPEEGFAVQLFSFPDVDSADAKVSELSEAGYKAYRVEGLVKGETWFRVRVGPYPSREEADGALPTLASALGVADPLVTAAR